MSENTLTTVEQKSVTFYDDELIAVRADDGQIYVSVRHLCAAIGVARQRQVRKIKEHHVLAKGYSGGTIMIPPGPRGGGGRQRAGLLRVDLVPLWLSGLDTRKVKEGVRPKLERYQEEVAKVLWDAFQSGRLTTTPTFDDLLKKDSPAVNAYKMAVAVVELARHQVLMEARLDEYGERLEAIEASLGDPGRVITPDQAMQISQAVKAIAMAMSKRSGRNEYGGVYGEFYRQFGIPSYKQLPARRFEEAFQFLNEWYRSLTDQDIPF